MFQSVICQWHNSSDSIFNWLSFADQRSRRDINQLDRCARLRIVLLFKQKIDEQNKESLLFQISITLLNLWLFVHEIDSIVYDIKMNLIWANTIKLISRTNLNIHLSGISFLWSKLECWCYFEHITLVYGNVKLSLIKFCYSQFALVDGNSIKANYWTEIMDGYTNR